MQLMEYVDIFQSVIAKSFWLGMGQGIDRVGAILCHFLRFNKVMLRTEVLRLQEGMPWVLQNSAHHHVPVRGIALQLRKLSVNSLLTAT